MGTQTYYERLNDLRHVLDDRGRVLFWPSRKRRKLQRRVLEYLVSHFAYHTVYSEPEVNALLNKYHTFGDWALLRRELYEHGLLDRQPDGRRYWRPLPTGAPPEQEK